MYFPLALTPSTPNEPAGSCDSIHVFETAERGRQAHYKLTSTIMLQLTTRSGTASEKEKEKEKEASGAVVSEKPKGPEGLKTEGEITLSGSMTRQVCQSCSVGIWG